MNRRSTSKKPRILVDTTFLLPALGVEVEENAMKIIELFRKLEVYYLEIGVLEAMWKILKVIPLDHLNIVKIGLESIRNTYSRLDIPIEAYIEACKIYDKGHKDYIDALYYSTARSSGIPWLTIDIEFIEFLKRHSHTVDGVVYTPEDLERKLRKR